MLGAVLRSDGRDYGEIAKAGFFWGLILGVLGFIGVLIAGTPTPMATGFLTLISSLVGIPLSFLIMAGMYDISNYFIDN